MQLTTFGQFVPEFRARGANLSLSPSCLRSVHLWLLMVWSRDVYTGVTEPWEGQKRTLLGQMRAKRANICYFNANICQIEDICVVKASQRKMHITTFGQFDPEFRARGANVSLSPTSILH